MPNFAVAKGKRGRKYGTPKATAIGITFQGSLIRL